MSESKRSYSQVEEFSKGILAMREEGLSFREIAEHFGFKDKGVIKEFFQRRRKKERAIASGELSDIPRRRGRPAKTERVLTEGQQKDARIQQLEMENELLRSFLQLAGRM